MQTVELVFRRTDGSHEVHLPVENVRILPTRVLSGDQAVAVSTYTSRGHVWQLLPMNLLAGTTPDERCYDTLEVYRLMPSGEQLRAALDQFGPPGVIA